MAKPKQLKLPDNITVEENEDSEIVYTPFFDNEDSLFAKEHSGTYVMYLSKNNSSSRSSRFYLSSHHDIEYYDMVKKRSVLKNVGSRPKQSNNHLFDRFENQKDMIWEALQLIITEHLDYSSITDLFIGFGMLLEHLDNLNIHISSILDFDNNMQIMVHKNFDPKNRREEYRLSHIFYQLEKVIPDFNAIETRKKHQYNSIEALPNNVAFQLDYYSKIEILEIIENVNRIKQWREEARQNNIFAKKNLAKTYLDLQVNYKLYNNFSLSIEKIGKVLYDIDFRKTWKTNNELIRKMSKGGINIQITSKKIFLMWHDKLYPDFPKNDIPDPKYKSLFTTRSKFCVRYKRDFGESIQKLYSYMFPSLQTLYPLILFIQLREGLNAQTLQSWKVTKSKNGEYLLGDNSPLARIIEGEKFRSNTKLKSVLQNGSDQQKFIDFYLDWLQPIYEQSNKNNFFQYVSAFFKFRVYGKKFVEVYFSSNETLFNKYDIRDTDGTKISKINHQRIRSYSNYADYMRGYKEFERQFRKGHKHIDTQISYENSTEWKGEKDYKIAKTQDFVVEIFRGNKNNSEHHTAKLFQGLLADCKNPHEPTYEGHTRLKENEACGSWFKCLTQCNKSVVIPKVHGPNIYAWIEHMEQEKKDSIRIIDWEKEYLADYKSANVVIQGFTEEEKEYSQNNAYKSQWIMKKKFNSKLKKIGE